MSDETKPSDVAIHEAGHVVACHLFGLRHSHATAVPEGINNGCVWVELRRDEASIQAFIDVCFAGGEAVRIYNKTGETTLSELQDLLGAERLFEHYIANDTESFEGYRKRRRNAVGDLLRQNWSAVLSVASLLDDHQAIYQHQAQAVILQATESQT